MEVEKQNLLLTSPFMQEGETMKMDTVKSIGKSMFEIVASDGLGCVHGRETHARQASSSNLFSECALTKRISYMENYNAL